MSIFANVMDIFLDDKNIDTNLLIETLKKRGIQTTERYARIRLKHSKDMYALMKNRGILR